MGEHELKCWPEPFEAMWRGDKTHEFRRNDRGYAVGDVLHQREWVPHTGFEARGYYTGRTLDRRVTYVGTGFGIPDGFVCMSVEPINGGRNG